MRLAKRFLAVVAAAVRPPMQTRPLDSAEEREWKQYQSAWEMDPAPDPRSVFLAGYRAGSRRRDEINP
jgi:hypothetical protein